MVGVVFVIAMAFLSYYTIFMVKKKYHPEADYTISVVFDNVQGLKISDDVRVNGVSAGMVASIDLQDYDVLVRMIMYRRFIMHENYSILIRKDAALGGAHISINPGSPTDNQGMEIPVLGIRANLHGELDDPFGAISEVIRENRENINVAFQNIRQITDKINSGQGTVGKLINTSSVHDETDKLVKDLRETVEDAREQAPITSFIRAALTAF